MTASALHLLLERTIEITFLSSYGQFKGRLSPPFSKNAILRLAQYRAHADMSKRCELARCFVIGKLSNQRTMLQRYNRRQANAEMSQAIDHMDMLMRDLAAFLSTRRNQSGRWRLEITVLKALHLKRFSAWKEQAVPLTSSALES